MLMGKFRRGITKSDMCKEIEEAAEKYIETSAYMNLPPIDFIKFGAKWQQERMYSYDEVRAIAYKAYCIGQLDEPTEGKFNQWINDFKKK